MKKLTAILLAALMLLAVSACGGENGENDEPAGDGTLGKYDFYDYDLSEYVELGELNGIEISAADIAATDEEAIEQVHEFLVNNDAVSKMPVTGRAVQSGDFVNIDYVGTKDGVAFDGGTAQGYDLEIGSGTFIPGFEDGLIGAEIGQTVALDLTFPEHYKSAELAGKAVVFTVTINSIRAYSYPEINEEFIANNFSQYDSVDSFLADVKTNIVSNKKWTLVREKLLDGAKVLKYPEKEIASFENELNDNYQNYADSFGISLEQFVENYMGMSYETFRQQVTDYAQGEVKTQMVCVAFARNEGIELSEDEFNEYVAYYANKYNCASNDECLQKYGRNNITIWGLTDTVIQTAVDNCVVN